MKQISDLFLILLFVFLVLFSHSTSDARLLAPYQGEQMVKANAITHADSSIKIKDDDILNLMGLEEYCDEKDEECMKRRMVAEAHLDYIYTQRHNKPKGSP